MTEQGPEWQSVDAELLDALEEEARESGFVSVDSELLLLLVHDIRWAVSQSRAIDSERRVWRENIDKMARRLEEISAGLA